ncbi:MAG: dienelactone hydrolase family protein [Candidatus Lustribacter sp.]
MERKKATDFPQELLDLFQLYVHHEIDRNAFLAGAGKFAAGDVTASDLLAMLKPNYALALQVPETDARITAGEATVASPQGNGSIKGYLVRRAGANGKLPAVLVVHENRGLNPYIKDVARRLAVEGYLAFAPDSLTSAGGYPGDDEKAGELFKSLDRDKMIEDFVAAAAWLAARSDVGKVGVVGFCFGGGVANTVAIRMPALAAAVPFYGGAPAAAEVPKIKAAVQPHYAGLDTRLTSQWPAYDAEMTAAHVTHEGYVYPQTNHGFHNDTTPRYDDAAAKLAWSRTLSWFDRYLKSA